MSADTSLRPFTSSPGDECLQIAGPGFEMRFLARSEQTDGPVAMEMTTRPGYSIPLHSKALSEIAYVLEGKTRWQLGDSIQEAAAGASIFVPADTPLGYRNIGAGDAKVLHVIFGGEFDKFAVEFEPLVNAAAVDPQAIVSLILRYGMTPIAAEIAD